MSSSLLPLQAFMQHKTLSDSDSKASASSCGTVQRHQSRETSHSTRFRGSMSSNKLRVTNENVYASANSSRSSLQIRSTSGCAPSPTRTSRHNQRRSSWTNDTTSPQSQYGETAALSDLGPLEDVDLNSLCDTEDFGVLHHQGLSVDVKGQGFVSAPRHTSATSQENEPVKSFVVATSHPFTNGRPFRKWVGSLRRQSRVRKRTLTARQERWTLDDIDDDGGIDKPTIPHRPGESGHKTSKSWSASGVVTSVNTGTSTSGSKHTGLSPGGNQRSYVLRTNKRSRLSSAPGDKPIHESQQLTMASDQEACDRGIQRRKILEELVSSEEGYVADLKVLLHVKISSSEWESLWVLMLVRSTSSSSTLLLRLPKLLKPVFPKMLEKC